MLTHTSYLYNVHVMKKQTAARIEACKLSNVYVIHIKNCFNNSHCCNYTVSLIITTVIIILLLYLLLYHSVIIIITVNVSSLLPKLICNYTIINTYLKMLADQKNLKSKTHKAHLIIRKFST